ncbi:MAG: DNA repair protein RadA ['Candidatus Kapabacteria' thiocyanatum]|uniref:DNA repair protein RadA n=1 Tax=Candidatus Kapaibacterium thiocyanatum TaxID=1895771 RepID=A0A1M3L629_9BACT|nr:DNA repair protein RadA ['Candidatus Kapabacteria' thiocyanatum]OJX60914.1 MAG: DNA repair protein RadA ['Candidatus Kapabacteria' thiocyanatum]
MKTRSIYRCSMCGTTSPRWAGKCPGCGQWNTMIEEIERKETASRKGGRRDVSAALGREALALQDVDTSESPRLHTGMGELDRVLGGGLTVGSIVLVGGDPGMGKSTLMLQLSATVPGTALYISGEESLHQIKHRAERLGVAGADIRVAAETNIEVVAALIESVRPAVVIVDSVQTMMTDMLESTAGSVAQVRECTALLTKVAKKAGIPIILIGHVTKDGMIAGPKVLEHMVDTVLQFEGDGMYSYRVLRALKNRYGSTNEIGVFDMSGVGLREVPNPSEVLLSQRRAGEPGTAIVAVMEGTRPLLVEVQALVSPTGYSMPQRVSTGYDARRLQMILAILEKRGGIVLRQNDVFVNIAGGIAIQDPAIDLGVAVALASSATDVSLPSGTVFMGELGLTGEVRHVSYADQRVQEALRLGLRTVYLPRAAADTLDQNLGEALVPIERIAQALSILN